jgi:hypothetical protein
MEGYAGLDPNLLLAKMGEGGNDDKSWWLILLILLYGRDGFGGQGQAAGAAACCPPVTQEQLIATQNAIMNQTAQRFDAHAAQLNQAQNAVTERTLDITRDQAANAFRNETGQALIGQKISEVNTANLIGQKDLTAAIVDCCCQNLIQQKETQGRIDAEACETRNVVQAQGLANINATNVQALSLQNAIEKCCCESQNAIAMQTQQLLAAGCANTEKITSLITQNRIDELQAQLTDAKLSNSNLAQTTALQQSIREACCQPCHPPHPWWGNGGGPPGPPFGAAAPK